MNFDEPIRPANDPAPSETGLRGPNADTPPPAQLQNGEAERHTPVDVHLSEVDTGGGDVNVAARDVHVTKYVQGLAHLRPRLISREDILRRDLFEPPGGHENTLRFLKPFHEQREPIHVLVLVAERGAGARTVALRLLDEILPHEARIFELLPDWERPDVALIPEEQHTGYLLNLSFGSEHLSDQFREHLEQYAARARGKQTRLIVLANRETWGPVSDDVAVLGETVAVARAKQPSAAGVLERRLRTEPGKADRVTWLTTSDSLFYELLTSDTRPGEAVRLAGIMARAKGPDDANAQAEYKNWAALLEKWFSGSETEAPRKRALQISAAFLDCCPARVVLDAADQLLAAKTVNWPSDPGGPLGGPDAKTRCSGADIAFLENGTASISKDHPGIERALLRHVWHTRPQLVPVLKDWLGQISSAKGIAEDHRERLAESLTTLAEAEGPSTILNLVEQWLAQEGRKSLAVNVLDDLAVHPLIGAAVRDKLRNWAKGSSLGERQRAVVAACGRRLGAEFPHIALTRLRYVLDQPADAKTKQAALGILAGMLGQPLLAAQVLKEVVDWLPGPGSSTEDTGESATTFITLMDLNSPERDEEDAAPPVTAQLLNLLNQEGTEGKAIRLLLMDGWRAAWQHAKTRSKAALALDSWCRASEAGNIPADTLVDIISVVFEEEADSLGDDLNHILGGDSELRRGLRNQYAQAIRAAMAARTSTPVTVG